MSTVENSASAHVRILRCGVECECTAYAKANYADLLTGECVVTLEIVDRAADILFRFVDAQRHTQLVCFIRRVRSLAVIQIRRDPYESLARESLANVFDVIDESPPLLNHDQAWSSARFGNH